VRESAAPRAVLREAARSQTGPQAHRPLHTVDEADEFVYFTMAYVRGGTLADRILAEGPLPVGELARILRQVAVACSTPTGRA